MKETIYTIPINDAFDCETPCAICSIENKIDANETEMVLGPSMMEPDYRINSNNKGFCKNHYKKLTTQCKALPLALVLQTYSEQQNNDIFASKVESKTKKKNFFKKETAELLSAQMMIEHINKTNSTCVVCEKVDEIMNRYYNNIIYIWKTQEEFRKKFEAQNGFCVPHFAKLLEYALKGLDSNTFTEFYHSIITMQEKSNQKIYNDISAFAKLFDHNSDKKASDDVKNAISRTIQKYASINCDND